MRRSSGCYADTSDGALFGYLGDNRAARPLAIIS
jgi:hypothetical protein